MLNLDISVLFILVLIWILMNILNRLYFKPIGEIVARRDKKIKDDSRELEILANDIEERTGQIEDVLAKAKKDSLKIKEELIKKGEELKEQLVLKAKDDSQKISAKKMSELEKDIILAEKKLEKEIAVFSDNLKEIFL